jgi:hypothetical protein
MNDQHYSKSVGDLVNAIENGSLTVQQIAEAFAIMDDDELEQPGTSYAKRDP